MPFSFPSSPSVGQTSTQNGRTYIWSGHAWRLLDASGGNTGAGSIAYDYATTDDLPATGDVNLLYCTTDTGRFYRWTGSVYAEVGPASGGEDAVLRSFFLPPAPTNVAGTAGNAQVALTWTAPTVLSQTPITDYVVQYSSNSGSTWTTFSDGTSATASAMVTGLTNDTAYTFRVAAVNGVGQSAWSTASGSVTPAASVSLQYLVVGGGGAGGGNTGGGGGAGQVLAGTSAPSSGSVLSVVVGTGGTPTQGNGGNGALSSLIGGGLNLSAAGGGGGGGENTSTPADRAGATVSGASGGGGGGAGGDGSGSSVGGSGTYSGGTSGSSPSSCNRTGGGGGGSTSNGGNAQSAGAGSNAGIGGSGTLSTITGSSAYYAAGGGGGGVTGFGCPTNQAGSGGSDNAGSGSTTGDGGAAAANSGSGGGGGAFSNATPGNYVGGAGGSGVVIVRIGQQAVATTGSPSVAQVGSDYVYTFTANGSLTV